MDSDQLHECAQEPLVPPEVDLRDFGFMPLDVGTLLSSTLWVKAKRDPRVGHAAMSLWCKAWHEVPASSLPNDDELLADFAGCSPEEFERVRDRVLANFVLCSDGRLYHETIAKKAHEAWAAKLARVARTAAATAAREAKRAALDKPPPAKRRGARDDNVTSTPQPNVTFTKGQGQGQGQGQGDSLFPTPEGVGGGAAQSAAPPPPPPFDGNNGETLNGKAVVQLASTWELPEPWGLDAEALGWKPAEVLRESERFRQYWTAGKGAGTRRSVKGWRQSWANWLSKAERMSR